MKPENPRFPRVAVGKAKTVCTVTVVKDGKIRGLVHTIALVDDHEIVTLCAERLSRRWWAWSYSHVDPPYPQKTHLVPCTFCGVQIQFVNKPVRVTKTNPGTGRAVDPEQILGLYDPARQARGLNSLGTPAGKGGERPKWQSSSPRSSQYTSQGPREASYGFGPGKVALK